MPKLLLTVLLLPALGCGAEASPPEIVLDRTACAGCGMLVSEMKYAAAFRESGSSEPRVFDDIGCLLAAWPLPGAAEPQAFWVLDFETGGWLDGKTAFFVDAGMSTPMGYGIVAVASRPAAEALAGRHDGSRVLDYRALIGAAAELASEHREGGAR